MVGERRGGRGRPATRSPLAARPRFVLSPPTTSSVPIGCADCGAGVRRRLFDSSVDPIGRQIRIGAHIFRVVGVMTRKGQSSGGQDQDDAVFVPVTTAQKKLMENVTYLRDIYVSAATSEAVAGVAENIRHLLRRLHQIAPGGPDDFRVRTLEDIIAVRTRTVRTMTTLLSAVAAVSLLVGGIGVMNIMLVAGLRSAPGRSGIRLAVGARQRDVRLQFLTEAIVISLAGGAFGVVTGVLFCEIAHPSAGMANRRRSDDGVIGVRRRYLLRFFLAGTPPAAPPQLIRSTHCATNEAGTAPALGGLGNCSSCSYNSLKSNC